ncbi:MAG: bile acid:sodium symporter [Chitinophagales bacterium]|nr:bile acid:sodium symporter [Chitinophagales bacterium]
MSFIKIHTQIKSRLASFGIDNFILGMLTVVFLAYLFPQWGAHNSPIPFRKISNIGVPLIFFFYGLKLSPENLRSGLKNVHLHFLVQISTFIIFPFIILIASWLFQPEASDMIWVGIFLLAALPSTVSSSVVMVSIAHGNIPAAIFNASISSLIGVLMTPIIMNFFMSTSQQGMDLTQVIIDLILQVIVPVGLGLFLHPYFKRMVERHIQLLKIFDQTIIIMIVYISFCESFLQGLFGKINSIELIILSVSMMLLFFVSYFSITKISRLMNFSKEDTITAAFCGSKKSLVHGTVMSSVLFKNNPSIGIILLPLMIYHTLQLIAASIIAEKLSKRKR